MNEGLPTQNEIRADLADLPEGSRRGLMQMAQQVADREFTTVPWVPRQWVEQIAWELLKGYRTPQTPDR